MLPKPQPLLYTDDSMLDIPVAYIDKIYDNQLRTMNYKHCLQLSHAAQAGILKSHIYISRIIILLSNTARVSILNRNPQQLHASNIQQRATHSCAALKFSASGPKPAAIVFISTCLIPSCPLVQFSMQSIRCKPSVALYN